jgi:hypothetical protein
MFSNLACHHKEPVATYKVQRLEKAVKRGGLKLAGEIEYAWRTG